MIGAHEASCRALEEKGYPADRSFALSTLVLSKLIVYVGARQFYFPRAIRIKRFRRNQRILAEIDASASISKVARSYRMTAAQVYLIVQKRDEFIAPSWKGETTIILDLFARALRETGIQSDLATELAETVFVAIGEKIGGQGVYFPRMHVLKDMLKRKHIIEHLHSSRSAAETAAYFNLSEQDVIEHARVSSVFHGHARS